MIEESLEVVEARRLADQEFEEWAKYQAEHEMSEEEREQLTAKAVEAENQ